MKAWFQSKTKSKQFNLSPIHIECIIQQLYNKVLLSSNAIDLEVSLVTTGRTSTYHDIAIYCDKMPKYFSGTLSLSTPYL